MKDTESRFFRAWGELVIRHRALVLLLIVGLCAVSVWTIKERLYVDNSPEAFADSSSDAARNLDIFRDVFGRDDVTLLLIEGDVFSKAYLDKLAALQADMEGIDIELKTLGQRRRAGPPGSDEVPEPEPPAEEQASDPDDEFGGMDDDLSEGDDDGWGEEAGGSVIEEVISIINVRKIRAVDDGIEVGDLLDPMPDTPSALAAVRNQVLGNPEKGLPADDTIVGQVVSADGKFSAMVLRAQFMSTKDSIRLSHHIYELVDKHEGPGFRIHVGGLPALNATFEKVILKDMQMLTAGMLFVIALVLLFMFVHPAALSPILVVAASAIWALGFQAALGVPVTGITNILPAFLICVGVADSVHLMSIYRRLRMTGLDTNQAAVGAVADTGIPVFFTSVTTSLGLLSFSAASVDAIGDMGRTGAFGVLAAFFNTMTLLPVMLSFNKRSMLGADRDSRMGAVDRFLALCAGLSGTGDKSRRTTLLVSAVLSAAAAFGASTLYVWHDPLVWIPEEQPIKQAFSATDEHLSGTANVQLLIEGTTDRGVKDLRLQQGMVDLAAHIRAYENPTTGEAIVGNARGVADMLREINRALHGGGSDEYALPDRQEVVDNYFVLVENSGPEDLKRLMTLDAEITQMTIGMKWQEATSYIPLAKHISEGIEKHMPEDVARVSMTGAVYNLLSTVGLLIFDMVRTFGVAFLAISIIMVLLLRDWKLGLIAMAPNLLPIVFILGLMGYADIPIDMMNLMIASIALGIAVDDTIHFLHHYRVHYDVHGKVEAAIQHSLQHTGRALVVTSVILSLGFFVYLFSMISGISRFGMLIGLTVIIAVVLDLTMAPALLRTFFQDRE